MTAERNPTGEGAASSRRRVWCELTPLEELADGVAFSRLARFGVAPIVAVRPSTPPDLAARVVARARERGLGVALWPMLGDEDGRWCNAGNAAKFSALVARLAEDLAARRALPDEIVFDLEPPIAAVKGAFAEGVRHHFAPLVARAPAAPAVRALARVVRDLGAAGVAASAAVAPPVLFAARDGDAWEHLLGTPVTDDALAWSRVSAMLYTSILEGWSRGLVDRGLARALLAWGCRAAVSRFGAARAGASIGAVGVGALGDEPVYRDASELADDVGVARASGVEDLALFELRGVLAREDPDRWLAAFVETPPAAAVPELPAAARAALRGLSVAGTVVARLVDPRRSRSRGRTSC